MFSVLSAAGISGRIIMKKHFLAPIADIKTAHGFLLNTEKLDGGSLKHVNIAVFFIEEAGDHYSDGACNRNAPVMTTSGFTKRPNVHKGHWCGDWEKTDEGINVK